MDKNLEDIINRVALKNGLSPVKVKLAVETFFKNAKYLMQREDMPTIMMHGLGRLTPDETRIKKKLVLLSKKLKEDPENEEYKQNINKLNNALEKIKRNKHRRNS